MNHFGIKFQNQNLEFRVMVSIDTYHLYLIIKLGNAKSDHSDSGKHLYFRVSMLSQSYFPPARCPLAAWAQATPTIQAGIPEHVELQMWASLSLPLSPSSYLFYKETSMVLGKLKVKMQENLVEMNT